MKALSDPNRVRALKLLEQETLCACEIQECMGLAQSTVSNHMKILEDADLITKERRGTWMYYSRADGSASIYAQTMLASLVSWLDDDPELQRMLHILPRTICRRKLSHVKSAHPETVLFP